MYGGCIIPKAQTTASKFILSSQASSSKSKAAQGTLPDASNSCPTWKVVKYLYNTNL